MSRTTRDAAIDLVIREAQELPVPALACHVLPWTAISEYLDRERRDEPPVGRHRLPRLQVGP